MGKTRACDQVALLVYGMSHESSLMVTGCSLGLLHVLAGPDHLSALAVLAVGNSWRAVALGIRWGLGHSTGLVFVAIIFIALKGDLDLKTMGRYCDSLVGIFMIILGCYGVLGALKIQKEKMKKREDAKEKDSDATALEKGDGYQHSKHGYHSHTHDVHEDDITECSMCPFVDMRDPFTQRLVSFSIGILHGVAGPGGILGVLPAVEMRSWRSSTLYLGSFIFASTVSMGAFSALYGEVTKRLGATQQFIDFALRVFSSSMSIIVGTIWFVLSVLGKLEDFFH